MHMLPMKERMERLNELQQETIEDIKAAWGINLGVACIRPTGFGKTFTAGRLLRETDDSGNFKYKDVVFICPSEAVMMQFNNELLYEGEQKKQIPCRIFRNGKLIFTHDDYNDNTGVTIRELTYALVARRFGHDEIEVEQSRKDNKSRVQQVVDIFGKNVDLIIMDEFHNAGGEKTIIGLVTVLEDFFKNVKKLGITATYDRTDKLDVGYELFGDTCLTPEYTYAQAVDDGVLPAITYFCNDYGSVLEANSKYKELKELAKTNDKIATYLPIERRKFQQTAELVNISDVIRANTIEVIGKAVAERFSQKWIVFYPNTKDLLNNWKRVENWYKKAFPTHTVQSIIVIDKPEYRNNREVVCAHGYHKYNPHKEDRIITLIFNVNMLLEAVHLDHVTGLLLFTNTKSTIKYYQTLGRVIDSKRETEPLVIDMMDGYTALLKKLEDDIKKANAGRITTSRKANTIGIRDTDSEPNSEEYSILTKLKVKSNKLTHNEFHDRLVRLGNLAKLRRTAMEVMNQHIKLVTAAKIESLPLTMLVQEIKEIQETGQFSASQVMVESKAKRQKAVRTERTGMIDPFSEEEYVNVIYSENGYMDETDYNKILAEYEAIKAAQIKKRGEQ